MHLSNKLIRGQYYTTTNPFVGGAFDLWNSVRTSGTILEQFAGAGHILSYFDEQFDGYDIEPNNSQII